MKKVVEELEHRIQRALDKAMDKAAEERVSADVREEVILHGRVDGLLDAKDIVYSEVKRLVEEKSAADKHMEKQIKAMSYRQWTHPLTAEAFMLWHGLTAAAHEAGSADEEFVAEDNFSRRYKGFIWGQENLFREDLEAAGLVEFATDNGVPMYRMKKLYE